VSPAVTVYTDGGCRPNPGPGGWGVVILGDDGEPVEMSGSEAEATNNRMELQAAIEALRALDESSDVALHTDSTYLRQGVTMWMAAWKRKGWRTAGGDAVKNRDLWEALERELLRHRVRWTWVRGHAGNRWNERADALASAAIPRQVGLADDPSAVHVVLGIAFSGKLKRAAWTAVLRYRDHEKDMGGRLDGVTPNGAHVVGAALALESLTRRSRIHVYTASDYLKDGATSWIRSWKARGWRTRDGKPVSNRAAWERLDGAAAQHRIEWHAVPSDTDWDLMKSTKRRARQLLKDEGI
jgi:ribonuclease HI